jgi:amidophosphoribosyltransferase
MVFFASTFPPVAHPCAYGIDFPTKEQLIAYRMTLPQICQEIGADALIFNDLERLKQAIGLRDLCDACITGNYPTSTEGLQASQALRDIL